MKTRLFFIITILFFSAKQALAVCPVCTIAVGAGLGLAQWLGIDDTISGVWIGAFTVSLAMWTVNWLNTKNIRFIGRKIAVTVGYYLLIVAPLWWKGIIGHPYNRICGTDKLLFGILLGSMLFFGGVVIHSLVRKKNEGKSYFAGQKIVFALIPLIIATVILYFSC